jgi:hypothetical protein
MHTRTREQHTCPSRAALRTRTRRFSSPPAAPCVELSPLSSSSCLDLRRRASSVTLLDDACAFVPSRSATRGDLVSAGRVGCGACCCTASSGNGVTALAAAAAAAADDALSLPLLDSDARSYDAVPALAGSLTDARCGCGCGAAPAGLGGRPGRARLTSLALVADMSVPLVPLDVLSVDDVTAMRLPI